MNLYLYSTLWVFVACFRVTFTLNGLHFVALKQKSVI
jgi:hypothetical protein